MSEMDPERRPTSPGAPTSVQSRIGRGAPRYESSRGDQLYRPRKEAMFEGMDPGFEILALSPSGLSQPPAGRWGPVDPGVDKMHGDARNLDP